MLSQSHGRYDSQINHKTIVTTVNHLTELAQIPEPPAPMPPVPTDFIPRFCYNLFPGETRTPKTLSEVALKVANICQNQQGISNKSPLSIAAACIYMACEVRLS